MHIEVSYGEWDFKLSGKLVEVTHVGHDETRQYGLPDSLNIKSVEHSREYVYINADDGGFYQFKFEEGDFLVGDIFDKNGEHINSFASWVFGEDLHLSN
jgi:hypothetical protein